MKMGEKTTKGRNMTVRLRVTNYRMIVGKGYRLALRLLEFGGLCDKFVFSRSD
jgi:hypothetical protein